MSNNVFGVRTSHQSPFGGGNGPVCVCARVCARTDAGVGVVNCYYTMVAVVYIMVLLTGNKII